MSKLGIARENLMKRGALATAREICQQPATWQQTYRIVSEQAGPLHDFMQQTLAQPNYDVVLTGAGTSEFVGNALEPAISPGLDFRVRSCATTDIVLAPTRYLSSSRPTLMISFARSGDSPESVGAVQAAERVCGENVRHLVITCNEEGALAKRAAKADNTYAILLPPQTNDAGFAMTSSFSCMYLAALCACNLDMLGELAERLDAVSTEAAAFLDSAFMFPTTIVQEFDFKRLVYLGSAALKGIAQESALKMLELSAGQVETMFDSPMGFRHGPKSIVDDNTLTVLYLSDNANARRYELDLLREMAGQRNKNKLCVLMNETSEEASELADYCLMFDAEQSDMALPNAFLALPYVCFAQTLALKKSLALGLSPDNPCPTGEVNRVVQGVTIY